MKLSTKQDWQELLLALSEPLTLRLNSAELTLGHTGVYYGKNAASMEGISRLLWGFVPYYAGGGSEWMWNWRLLNALDAGTDPDNTFYWGGFTDKDQKFVEMAAIAYSILFAKEQFWESLSDTAKDHLADYLYQINRYKLPECNWVLFAVLVNLALKSVGRKYSDKKLGKYLDLVESFYEGDGWYRDGDSNQKDYYISFAIHYYCLMYAIICKDSDPKRSGRFKERAEVFAKQFIYWFDNTGRAIPFGRSLTYRFAQASFFSMCILADIHPFSLGEMKGIITRHMDYWMSQDILDNAGILTIGYSYPNLVMAEAYNAPGSPYWGYKIFSILMLPDDHEFWSVPAEPYPQVEPVSSQPYADKLMVHSDNHTTAYPIAVFSPFGHGQSVAKYGKFAYNSRFGFSVAKSCYELSECAPDNMLVFEIGGYYYVRRIGIEGAVKANHTWSKWSPYPGITVETTITPDTGGYLAVHKVVSEIECTCYDCGFSVASRDSDDFSAKTEKNTAKASNRFSSCSVSAKGMAKGMVFAASPNTNVMYQNTSIPCVAYEVKAGTQVFETRVNISVVEE